MPDNKKGQQVEFLTKSAHHSHMANLWMFGQWQILDDGDTHTKVWTLEQWYEYIMDVSGKSCSTCYELQEMIWPYEHVMVQDDRDGHDFMRHFHRCQFTKTLVKSYKPKILVFLSNDLEPSKSYPPKLVVTKGRHQVMCMQSGHQSCARRPLEKDKFKDDLGNLFRRSPQQDNPKLIEPTPTLETMQRSDKRQPSEAKTTHRRGRPSTNTHEKCGNHGEQGNKIGGLSLMKHNCMVVAWVQEVVARKLHK